MQIPDTREETRSATHLVGKKYILILQRETERAKRSYSQQASKVGYSNTVRISFYLSRLDCLFRIPKIRASISRDNHLSDLFSADHLLTIDEDLGPATDLSEGNLCGDVGVVVRDVHLLPWRQTPANSTTSSSSVMAAMVAVVVLVAHARRGGGGAGRVAERIWMLLLDS